MLNTITNDSAKRELGLVSVLIVNYNGIKFLETCLKSLYNQTYQQFEIIFVDNNSIDNSLEYVKSNYPKIKTIKNKKNFGFAKGNNIGLKYCSGEYILLLNNDTKLDKNLIKNLVSSFKNDNVATAGCKVYSLIYENKVLSTIPKIDPNSGKAVPIIDDSEMRAVDYIAGNSMMIKRKIIDQLGFLDNVYFSYYEETDFCARVIRAGYINLYVPSSKIWHNEKGTSSAKFQKYYIMRNQIRFVIKNFDLIYLPRAILGNFTSLLKIMNGSKQKQINDEIKENEVIKSDKIDYNVKSLFLKAVIWNILFLPQTIYSRIRDNSRIGTNKISYNKNLPLKDYHKLKKDVYQERLSL